jgi:hypothetical protein
MAAEIGNLNAIRTGRHSKALVTGKYPKGLTYVRKQLLALARALEAALMDSKGRVDIQDQFTIRTVCRCEAHARLCQHVLNSEWATLTVDQKQSLSRDIAKASIDRDKALRALELTVNGKVDALTAFCRQIDSGKDSASEPAGLGQG